MPNAYQKSIASLLRVDAETARLVEGMMRVDCKTLDGLNASAFDALATDCLIDVRTDREMASRIADAVGLPRISVAA